MLTERATTSASVKTDIKDCEDISIFAWWVSGRVSAGAKLTAFETDRNK
jgi:hypothetical protein